MLCPKCRVDFPDDRSYRAHAIESHGAPPSILQGDIGVVLPQGAHMISPVSPTDVVAFDETPPYIPTTQRPKKTDKEEKVEQPQEVKEASKESDKPIVLSYKYSGTCPDCHVEVTTVMLTVKEVLHSLALCPKCQNVCQTTEVEPIGKMSVALKKEHGKRTDK